MAQPTRQEGESRLAAKAWQDPAFKQQLISDPRAVLQTEWGFQVPANVKVTVLEESPSQIYIVLPMNQAELSDEDLDAAAGGCAPPCCHGG